MWTEMKYTCNMSVGTYPDLEAVVTLILGPYTAYKGTYALTVLTEWDESKGLDNTHI